MGSQTVVGVPLEVGTLKHAITLWKFSEHLLQQGFTNNRLPFK
jgi:hypothetical protein